MAPANITIDKEKNLSIKESPISLTQEQSSIKKARPNSPTLPGVINPNVKPTNNEYSDSLAVTSGLTNLRRKFHL